GQTFADIDVAVLNDDIVEETEAVVVTLTGFGSHDPDITLDSNPANLTATVNITDDDTATVSVAGTVDGNEGSPRTSNATFTGTQTLASSTDTVVNFPLGGTAVEGSDYTAVTPSVTIPAGAKSATITLPVTNDAFLEGTETATATLSSLGSHDTD